MFVFEAPHNRIDDSEMHRKRLQQQLVLSFSFGVTGNKLTDENYKLAGHLEFGVLHC
jgi:hypothetical protein